MKKLFISFFFCCILFSNSPAGLVETATGCYTRGQPGKMKEVLCLFKQFKDCEAVIGDEMGDGRSSFFVASPIKVDGDISFFTVTPVYKTEDDNWAAEKGVTGMPVSLLYASYTKGQAVNYLDKSFARIGPDVPLEVFIAANKSLEHMCTSGDFSDLLKAGIDDEQPWRDKFRKEFSGSKRTLRIKTLDGPCKRGLFFKSSTYLMHVEGHEGTWSITLKCKGGKVRYLSAGWVWVD
jgi:hypothetical protein